MKGPMLADVTRRIDVMRLGHPVRVRSRLEVGPFQSDESCPEW